MEPIPNIVLDILKVGFIGFSFLMMWLSYQLMKTLVRTTGMPIENLKEKMHAVVAYLIVTVFAICAALFFFWLDQGKTVNVTIEKSPSKHQKIVSVPLGTYEGEVPFEKRVTLAVKDRDRITIDMDDLEEFLKGLEQDNNKLKNDVDQLKIDVEGLQNTVRRLSAAGIAPGDEGGI